MRTMLGAIAGLGFLGIVFVGPVYLAVSSNAATAPRCAADGSCDRGGTSISDLR